MASQEHGPHHEGSFEKLSDHFISKTTQLKQCVEILDTLDSNPEAWQLLNSINEELSDLENAVKNLQSDVNSRKKALSSFEVRAARWSLFVGWQILSSLPLNTISQDSL